MTSALEHSVERALALAHAQHSLVHELVRDDVQCPIRVTGYFSSQGGYVPVQTQIYILAGALGAVLLLLIILVLALAVSLSR